MLHAADCNCSSSRGGTRCNCTACAQWAAEVQKYARKKRELFSVKKRGRQKIKKYWLAQSADLPTARLAGLALVLWSKPKENTSPRLGGTYSGEGALQLPRNSIWWPSRWASSSSQFVKSAFFHLSADSSLVINVKNQLSNIRTRMRKRETERAGV